MTPTSEGLLAATRAPVLLVSHGFGSNYERGFCNGLSDAGIPFTLLSSDRTDYAGLRPGTRTINLRGSQAEERSRWAKFCNMLRYHLALMLLVARTRPPAVHVIGLIEPPVLCGLIEGLWFRLWSRRYVLTVHDTEPHDRGSAWNRWLYSLSFRIATHLVVHTARLRDEFVTGRGFAAVRVVVMEHGIEPLAEPLPPAPRGGQPRPFKLLVFGVVARYKGIDLLLEALRGFPAPFELTIAGWCPNANLAAELRREIAAHEWRDSIHRIDRYLLESEVPALFLNADALVLPYRRIDQSGVLFQALRFGLPVVASRVGAFEHYVQPAVGECCEPEDAGSLRSALERLLARYPSLDRGQIRAIGRHCEWQQVVQVLAPLYQGSAASGEARLEHTIGSP